MLIVVVVELESLFKTTKFSLTFNISSSGASVVEVAHN